jgi:hypothetical protein
MQTQGAVDVAKFFQGQVVEAFAAEHAVYTTKGRRSVGIWSPPGTPLQTVSPDLPHDMRAALQAMNDASPIDPYSELHWIATVRHRGFVGQIVADVMR